MRQIALVDYSLLSIMHQIQTYPSLGLILLLVIFVSLISGATDAPNAVATAISTRCLKTNHALIISSVFNFFGLVVMTVLSGAVLKTMFNMVDFSGDAHAALLALVAAMVSSILWGVFCWLRGIPASKSHALIAGITGSAIALNGMAGVVPSEWSKVIWGFVLSLTVGLVIAYGVTKVIVRLFAHANRHKATESTIRYQVGCSVVLSFLHGGQDGQKFVSIALLGMALSVGTNEVQISEIPLWLMLLCATMMALGTLIGGKRIIKKVALGMVKLDKYQGAAASTSTAATLVILTLAGMPCSTSQCSTSSIIGTAVTRGKGQIKWQYFFEMLGAWLITFPCCGLLGFVLAKLFMLL